MSQFFANYPPVGASGSGIDSFSLFQVPFGTSPTATGPNQTLTFTSVDGSVVITGNSLTDTIDFSSAGAGVSSVTNSDGTLTISPTAGAVVASLNLSHANTWTGQQTFSGVGSFLTVVPTNTAGLQFSSFSSATTVSTGQALGIDASGNIITIANAPVSNYVITADAGTTGALPANTYNNGSSGVGATLTGNSNGALPSQDGIAIRVGLVLLIKNEVTQANNGVYTVTQIGSGSAPYILTRATDANTTAQMDPQVVDIQSGTTQTGDSFSQTTVTPVIGTDNIVYTVTTGISVTQQAGTQITNAVPYWTAISKQLSPGLASFVFNPSTLQLTTGSLTFASGQGAITHLLGPTDQNFLISSGTSSGSGVAGRGVSISTSAGNAATTGTAGAAGDFLFSGALGGGNTGTSGTLVAGRASNFSFSGAAGGAATGSGSTTNTGGVGSAIYLLGGVGGAASGAGTTNSGGAGGGVVISAGGGGAGTDYTASRGGSVSISAGSAGVVTGAVSNGGNVTITGGNNNGGSGSGVGVGGQVSLVGGNGGTIRGGDIILTGGPNASGGGGGGNLTFTSGSGSNISKSGDITINVGAAGGSGGGAPSVPGGAISFTAGQGHAPSLANPSGAGGAISFTTGSVQTMGAGSSQNGANAGAFNITTSAGQSATGSGTGGNGGSVITALGAAGTSSSGTAGSSGQFQITQTLSGSDNTPMLALSPTLNTTGSPSIFNISLTDTASGSATKWFNATNGTSNTYFSKLTSTANSSGEAAIFATNGTNSVTLGMGNGGAVAAGAAFVKANSTVAMSWSSSQVSIGTGNLVINGTVGSNQITGAQAAATANTALKIGPNTSGAGVMTMTSGNQVDVQIGGITNYSFAPTSGTANWTNLQVGGTINQTGGANGNVTGIYFNPTITALGGTLYAFKSTQGQVNLTDTVGAGSGSLSNPILNLNQTWNTSASVDSISLNVTNTSSGSSSNLLNLKVGGVSQHSVDKVGKITFASGSNKSTGTAVLSSGTITVSNTEVTASSLIWVQYATGIATSFGIGGPSMFTTPTVIAGTSFVITGLNGTGTTNTTDNSTVQWWIIN